jgi:hypothetical protein
MAEDAPDMIDIFLMKIPINDQINDWPQPA